MNTFSYILMMMWLNSYCYNFLLPKQTSERRVDWPDVDEVIASTVGLIGRLEHDRQETIENLCHEKGRVQQLGEALDRESEKRQDLLEIAVQKGR